MATFVLVSGAWHAGWCWQRVVPLLEAQGHRALAPDLLGMGGEPTPLAEVTLAAWAEQIAAIIRAEDEPVVLVGHSRGGIVISSVAELVPERIASLVYLAALLVPDGESTFTLSPKLPVNPSPPPMLIRDDGTADCPPDAVVPWFYGTTEPEWAARALALLTPEPLAPMATPLVLSAGRFGSVRRAYIECAQDRSLLLASQRAMQRELPCAPVMTLDTDHSPFFSAPDKLAECLVAIAAG